MTLRAAKLVVLTPTRSDRVGWLDECTKSVGAALPDGGVHRIVVCPTYADAGRARRRALADAEYVAFVDDDDLVVNDSLRLCLDAIEATGVGAVFTDELLVNSDGLPKEADPKVRPIVLYSSIARQTRACHHLVIMRSSAVTDEALELTSETGAFMDWACKGSAALTGGALRLPIFGYHWRQHQSNLHRANEWRSMGTVNNTSVRDYLTSLLRPGMDSVPFFDSASGKIFRELPGTHYRKLYE